MLKPTSKRHIDNITESVMIFFLNSSVINTDIIIIIILITSVPEELFFIFRS